jgi:hypothetical protein
MKTLHACPCCGKETLPDIGEFDICTVCKWEDDPLQRNDPNDEMGANTKSLNQYRVDWLKSNPVSEAKKHFPRTA